MAEPRPDIQALFFSPRTIWLLPNDLVRSQFLEFFFSQDSPSGQPTFFSQDARSGQPTDPDPEAKNFTFGLRPRLETFGSLEQALARELEPPEMDELGRDLILYDLARPLAERLRPPENPETPGPRAPSWSGAEVKALAEDLGDGFDRLKLAGLSWDQIAQLPPAGLGRLLSDLGRRHDETLAALGRRDRFARRRQVLEELTAGRQFQTLAGVEEIICRWSQRLSPFETDFILALARGRRLELTLKVPAWVRDENIDHGSGFDLLRSIRRVEACPEPTLWLDFSEYQTSGDDDSGPPPALAYAADVLLAPAAYRRADPPDPEGRIKIIRAASAYQEVEEAARIIKERMLEGGLQAGDLALVAPDLGRYGPLLDDVARRFGLAIHFRRGDSLADSGPARAIMDLLALWDSNWERSRLMELIGNPYFQLHLNPAECRRLSLTAGVTDQRAGGGFEENLAKVDPGRDEARTARDLLAFIADLKKAGRDLERAGDWAGFAVRFKKLLQTLGWPGDLGRSPLEPVNQRAADLTAAELCARELGHLEETLRLSPRPPAVGPAEFRLWLESLFSRTRLASDQSPEGRIRVLNYYDLHGGLFEEIFFLGLGERVFPRIAPETRWWPEELVRGAAALLGRPLWDDPADRYRQEELLFAAGLGQARQRVWLFYPAGDENGRSSAPSPLLTALTELWTEADGQTRLPLENAPRAAAPPLVRAAGPDEMWVALAALPPTKWPEGWSRRPEISGVMAALNRRRERWRAQKGESRLSPEVMDLWLRRRPNHQGRPLLSPTFLADFEDCPFGFWGREVLRLSAEGDPIEQWPRTSEGSLIHQVLEDFFRPRLGPEPNAPGPPWPKGNDYETCWAELREILEREIDKRARRDPLGRRPLWDLRRRRLPEIMAAWLRREMAPEAETTRPLALEWSFSPRPGSQAEPWAFDPGDGRPIYFQGRADRLDQTDRGLSLRDYKLRDSLDFHLKKNRAGELQVSTRVWPILTYALAAADLTGRPVEAGFDLIEAVNEQGRLKVMATDQPEMLRPSPDQELEGFNFPRRLAESWQRLQTGRFQPLGDPARHCRWCPAAILCPRGDAPEEPGTGGGENHD